MGTAYRCCMEDFAGNRSCEHSPTRGVPRGLANSGFCLDGRSGKWSFIRMALLSRRLDWQALQLGICVLRGRPLENGTAFAAR